MISNHDNGRKRAREEDPNEEKQERRRPREPPARVARSQQEEHQGGDASLDANSFVQQVARQLGEGGEYCYVHRDGQSKA